MEHLAVKHHLSASSQNQALSAILFLYRRVLQIDLDTRLLSVRGRVPERIPVVLSQGEIKRLLAVLAPFYQLIAGLLYGAGLRLLECLTLRIKDVDFDREELRIRRGKGAKDRLTMLPRQIVRPLAEHLARVKEQHDSDRRRGAGHVGLPDAIAARYPAASVQWAWQWVVPATRTYVDPSTRLVRRHHLHETAVQRAVAQAVQAALIPKKAGSTPYATVSQPICWSAAKTSAPSKSSLATPTFEPP